VLFWGHYITLTVIPLRVQGTLTAPWGGYHPLPLSWGNMNPLSLTLRQVLGFFLLAVAVCQPVGAMCQVRQEEMICWVV